MIFTIIPENANQNLTSRNDIALAVLSCLDLAIKIISPFSGNIKRATYVEIIDEVLHKDSSCHSNGKEKKQEETSDNQNDTSSASLPSQPQPQPQPSSSPTVQDTLFNFLKHVTHKDIVSRLSTKYNTEQFESARQLSRKLYTKMDHATVQRWVLDGLEYYLHPPTSFVFLGYFLDLLRDDDGGSVENYLISVDDRGYEYECCPTTATATTFDSGAISQILEFATMQIEIAMFDISLAMTKPSILAFCALQNAIIQHFYTQFRTATTPVQSSHESYFFATFMREKLQYSNILIGQNILNIRGMDSLFNNNDKYNETRNVMHCLFHHWKNNASDSDSTTQVDDIMSIDMYATLFQSNGVPTNINTIMSTSNKTATTQTTAVTEKKEDSSVSTTDSHFDEMIYSYHNHFIPIDRKHTNGDDIGAGVTTTTGIWTAATVSNPKKRLVSSDDITSAGSSATLPMTRIDNVSPCNKKRNFSELKTELVKNGAIHVPAKRVKCVFTSRGLKYI